MDNKLLTIGEVEKSWNVAKTRILKYTIEIYHKELKEHAVVSAPNIDILRNKVEIHTSKWKERWEIIENKRKECDEKEAGLEKALTLTSEAESAIKAIDDLLIYALSIDNTVDWSNLKRKDTFVDIAPKKLKLIPDKNSPPKPIRPTLVLGLFDKMFKSLKENKLQDNENRYNELLDKWKEKKETINRENISIKSKNKKISQTYQIILTEWEERKKNFNEKRKDFNNKIDSLRDSYLSKDPDAVAEYCDLVLSNSTYPDTFTKNFGFEYIAETKILVVEYQLPNQAALPSIKEVKYIISKKELKENYISESQIVKMYDEAIYKIVLRSIHELFKSDAAKAIDAISFNGWVKAINKATGKEENNCILSIQVKKNEFMEIDLAHVEPKTCFRNLKGIASSKLSSLTSIQPILQVSKADKRFVEAYEVADNMDDSTNLAAMDWEDFEHLIRELFEKEFASNGGEVKITQTSRDGGVDAIAFDPDPIRGGKIVIQAKRYTNTVGVSAVRDLYGTTLNEGATKGILVSTANYGPDAYKFAKGKPLTLLNGSNLLFLLEKHGYHVKIDLKEAKRILSENSF